jgi:hypothetical protein
LVVDALANARNLLVVVGTEFGTWQGREVDSFLQQTLDEGSHRLDGMEARAGASPHVNVGCRAGAGSWAR